MEYRDVFSFDNLKIASKKCQLGIRWKPSTQKYACTELLNISSLHKKLKNKTYKAKGVFEFDINERGKVRHIKSLHISDRVVQRCFCDNCLIPILTPKLIYDNGACLKNKGIKFTRDRLFVHLQKYYRHFGVEGYILVFDIKSYFDSIPHNLLKEKVNKYLKDKDLQALYSQLVDDCGGDKGLGLGSQISQISSVFYLNELDHFIKETLRIKYYARYMDDGYLLSPSKAHLQYCLCEIEKVCKSLGLQLSIRKTHIIKLSKGFTFMKRRYRLFPSGKILITASRDSKTRERRKIKKMIKKKVSPNAIRQSIISWQSSLLGTHSYHAMQNIEKLYKRDIKVRNDKYKKRIQ